jgi:hypothetical protein
MLYVGSSDNDRGLTRRKEIPIQIIIKRFEIRCIPLQGIALCGSHFKEVVET